MGKQFSWTQLFNPSIKREVKKLSSRRTAKQVQECLQLDHLFWIQNSKKNLPQSLEKLDNSWYCQVIRNAKYSRVGDSFLDPNQNVKCVRIDRVHIDEDEIPKTVTVVKRRLKRDSIIKKLKIESHNIPLEIKQSSPASSLGVQSSSPLSDEILLLTTSEIVSQTQRFLPRLEISPPSFSNPITMFKSHEATIDVLNYDFSFTSPLINL